MKDWKNIASGLIVCSLLAALPACSTSAPIVYDGLELHYQSSDASLADFLNDYAHRNLRYDDYAVGSFTVGSGTGFAKNWETMSLTWHNSGGTVLGEDKTVRILNYLNAIDQDDLGMIYNTSNSREAASVEAGEAGIPQGWPFPYWKYSVGNLNEFGYLSAVGSTSFEFNSRYDEQSQNWKAEGGTFEIDPITCYANFSSGTLGVDDTFRFYKDDLDELLPRYGGINTVYSPVLELALDFNSNNLKDYYIIWKTQEGGDEWFRVSHNELVTTQKTYFDSYSDRCYLSMYLNENWDNQIVTALGIEFVPVSGQRLSVTGGQIDYIRCNYDTRQSNATYQWILSFNHYVQDTNDTEALQTLMPKARRALLFLTHALEGENGLLDISYLYGHNGIGVEKNDDGTFTVDTANGVGNGYWDIIASPEKNLEANVYFYQALIAMAQLEAFVTDSGTQIDGTVSVRNRMPGGEDIVYDYTADELRVLADTVKANIEKDIAPVQTADGTYTNEGGFWNPETGRFALGVNERTGEVLDYGFVYWNEEAICAGIGTDEQQLSIMEWIDGRRTVSGDDSTGDDIYFYEFAPRMNTKDCTQAFSFCGYYIAGDLIDDYGTTWPRQVQNGGAVICWSYYDLAARAKVLGTENALQRLKEIQAWYEKVQENTTGDGLDFYSGYYDDIELDAELEGDEELIGIYKMQRAESDGPGTLGLDAEFIESVLLIRALPDIFFGMDSSGYNQVSYTNGLPDGLDYFQIDNMRFANCVYSVCARKDSLEILNLKGAVNPAYKILLKFAEPEGRYSVYLNGEETKDYTIENGLIVVEIPFGNVKVTVK